MVKVEINEEKRTIHLEGSKENLCLEYLVITEILEREGLNVKELLNDKNLQRATKKFLDMEG